MCSWLSLACPSEPTGPSQRPPARRVLASPPPSAIGTARAGMALPFGALALGGIVCLWDPVLTCVRMCVPGDHFLLTRQGSGHGGHATIGNKQEFVPLEELTFLIVRPPANNPIAWPPNPEPGPEPGVQSFESTAGTPVLRNQTQNRAQSLPCPAPHPEFRPWSSESRTPIQERWLRT